MSDPRGDGWAGNNARLGLRCEAIVKRLDPARIVYHHSSGNLSAMYTLNFYPNFVPIQELDDWFEHWSTAGVKPLFLVEYGAPFGWDWTMYRGWYNGQREFGSAAVPWEFCLAEWNAQFLGDAAYQISDREKANLRWEAQQFRAGRAWYRWDYPYPVGRCAVRRACSPCKPPTRPTTGGPSAPGVFRRNSPWEHDRFWKLRDGFQHRRQDLPVDWDNLQQPGYSPDFIDHTYAASIWLTSAPTGFPRPPRKSLLRNNMPLLAWIAGKPEHFTAKDHTFYPGETVEKQLIVINNSRLTVTCDASWSARLWPRRLEAPNRLSIPTGEQARVPVQLKLPADTDAGQLSDQRQLQVQHRRDARKTPSPCNVIPASAPPRPALEDRAL